MALRKYFFGRTAQTALRASVQKLQANIFHRHAMQAVPYATKSTSLPAVETRARRRRAGAAELHRDFESNLITFLGCSMARIAPGLPVQ